MNIAYCTKEWKKKRHLTVLNSNQRIEKNMVIYYILQLA